jgi:hypothetical protein
MPSISVPYGRERIRLIGKKLRRERTMLIKVIQLDDHEERTSWIDGVTAFTVTKKMWTGKYSVQLQVGFTPSTNKPYNMENVIHVHAERDGELLQTWKEDDE